MFIMLMKTTIVRDIRTGPSQREQYLLGCLGWEPQLKPDQMGNSSTRHYQNEEHVNARFGHQADGMRTVHDSMPVRTVSASAYEDQTNAARRIAACDNRISEMKLRIRVKERSAKAELDDEEKLSLLRECSDMRYKLMCLVLFRNHLESVMTSPPASTVTMNNVDFLGPAIPTSAYYKNDWRMVEQQRPLLLAKKVV